MPLIRLDLPLQHKQLSLALHHSVLPVPPVHSLTINRQHPKPMTQPLPEISPVGNALLVLTQPSPLLLTVQQLPSELSLTQRILAYYS